MKSFIFGKGQEYSNPEELARARMLAEALLGPKRAPQNVGEGLTALGQAIRGRIDMSRVNKAETAGKASANDAFSKVFGALNPASPGATAGAEPSSAPFSGDMTSGIRSTAEALGIDPVDLGTAISYETAGTFDPTKSGPTTQWGQHKGLIQFGEPQAKKYGVDWNDPVGSQLGPDGAVAKYLRDTGVKPGMGMLDIYSAINAGGVGRYNASDAGNGGAPGTVRDKVEQQMSAHRAKALALLNGGAGGPQVASADPNAGMAQALAQAPGAGQQIAPNNFGNVGMPDGSVAQGAFPPPPPAAPQQMAQAQGQPTLPQLLEAAQNPWLNEQQRGLVNMLIQQEMEKADPANQLDLDLKRAQLNKMTQPEAPEDYTLGPGQARFRGSEQIAAGPAPAPDLPSAVQEYEYAKGQGFPGTFADWEASKKGGMSLQVDPATGAVTFQQGQNIKPLTEGQSKDTVYATRAEGALPLIDQFGDALTSLKESVGGQAPVIGNYMKSPEYQQAEQAGTEFLQAILRKDTGAAITAGEQDGYGKVYLPRPGDSPELLAQKRASRQRALEAIKAGMPPQALLYVEKALANQNQPAGSAQKKPPVQIDGYTIEEVD